MAGAAIGGGEANASLPYSDHPDFNELVEYVEKVGPSQVYTINGFPELAAHLRSLGYPAVHLARNGEQQVDTAVQMKLFVRGVSAKRTLRLAEDETISVLSEHPRRSILEP